MGTQVISYEFSGNEKIWRAAIDTFLLAVATDPVLADGFSYDVYIAEEGGRRMHIPRWRDDDVLAHLQTQPFFGEFAAAVKEFAGESLLVIKPVISTDQ